MWGFGLCISDLRIRGLVAGASVSAFVGCKVVLVQGLVGVE